GSFDTAYGAGAECPPPALLRRRGGAGAGLLIDLVPGTAAALLLADVTELIIALVREGLARGHLLSHAHCIAAEHQFAIRPAAVRKFGEIAAEAFDPDHHELFGELAIAPMLVRDEGRRVGRISLHLVPQVQPVVPQLPVGSDLGRRGPVPRTTGAAEIRA